MTDPTNINYADFVPDFSEKEIQDSVARKVAAEGNYLWRVTGAVPTVSKADKPTSKGWQMIKEEWTALRPSDRAPSMLTLNTWTLLPLIPHPVLLKLSGYSGDPVAVDAATGKEYAVAVLPNGQLQLDPEAPETAQVRWTGRIGEILATFDPDGGPKKMVLNKFKDRMRAFQADSLPRLPDAKEVGNAAFQEARADQVRIVKTFARSLWTDASNAVKNGSACMLVNTEHYAQLFYEKDETKPIDPATGEHPKKEWPSVQYARHVSNPPKTKDGTLKPILDPFVTYK